MSLPAFTADQSLGPDAGYYRSSGRFASTGGAVWPAQSLAGFATLIGDHGVDFGIYAPISTRECCADCLSRCFCADEPCRRQCRSSCTQKCRAQAIGSCGCPPDRVVCHDRCCGPGELCTDDGCSPPNQVCFNRRCESGERCTSAGCCPIGNAVCNNRCCPSGWSCGPEGCCPPGQCCTSAPCPPGKYCCASRLCCPSGSDCRLVYGTAEYGCFT
jgi:hypothetical protein